MVSANPAVYSAAMFVSLMLLAACHTATTTPDDDTGSPAVDTEPPFTASLAGAEVFDPILGGPLAIQVETRDAELVELEVLDQHGAHVASVTDSWDGTDDDGFWVPTGTYTLRVTATAGEETAEDERELRMVRCGALTAWAEGDEGFSASHVPLYWHISRTLQGPEIPFSQADSLEGGDGEPVELLAPGEDLDFFPELGPVPVAFTWDSRPILTLELGDETVLGSAGLEGAEVGLEIEGWSALSGAEGIQADTPAMFQADEALGTGPGVLDEILTLQFVHYDDEGERWLLGEQALPVRWYLLLDEPAYAHPEDLYTAWVAAVDPALRALDGVEPTEQAVLDGLVSWIYEDLGLSYDTRYGASYFASYLSGWEPAVLNLSAFLRPDAGRTVNCSDCASILSAYANMVGVDLAYGIVLQNFDLNYILAIGGTEFTHCPFGSWGCSFSYHAVTSNDGNATIWDATLALDGDADPSNPPNELMMVHHVDAEEYLERLVTRGRASISYEGETLLQ